MSPCSGRDGVGACATAVTSASGSPSLHMKKAASAIAGTPQYMRNVRIFMLVPLAIRARGSYRGSLYENSRIAPPFSSAVVMTPAESVVRPVGSVAR